MHKILSFTYFAHKKRLVFSKSMFFVVWFPKNRVGGPVNAFQLYACDINEIKILGFKMKRFHANVSFLYPLKTLENRFSIFRRYRNGIIA